MIAITHTPTDGTSVGVVPPSWTVADVGLEGLWQRVLSRRPCDQGPNSDRSSATSRKTAAGN